MQTLLISLNISLRVSFKVFTFSVVQYSLGFDNPSEYWTTEKVNTLKDTLKEMFKEISSVCTTCN